MPQTWLGGPILPIALLLVVAAVEVVVAQRHDCYEATAGQKCMQPLQELINMTKPETEHLFKEICPQLARTKDCLKSYTKACFGRATARPYVTTLNVVNRTCDDMDFRRAFLQHGECMGNITKNCNKRVRLDDYPDLCRGKVDLVNCVGTEITGRCGVSAGKIAADILSSMLELRDCDPVLYDINYWSGAISNYFVNAYHFWPMFTMQLIALVSYRYIHGLV